MTDSIESLTLKIPSSVEHLTQVESFLDTVAEKHRIEEELYGNILVALSESVNNAILHGNQSEESKEVTLLFTIEENQIRIKVSDEGPGFDYENLPDPTAPENLTKPGGRGVFLMKQLSDEINFELEGATIEMVFYLA